MAYGTTYDKNLGWKINYELLFIYVLKIHVQLGYAMETQNPWEKNSKLRSTSFLHKSLLSSFEKKLIEMIIIIFSILECRTFRVETTWGGNVRSYIDIGTTI